MGIRSVVLGLGSNQGDRLQNLRRAVRLIGERWRGDWRISPIVETAAWLKPGAPPEWNQPFLNLVIEGALPHPGAPTPEEALAICQGIERELGRGPHELWAPRTIDIDLLFWEGESRAAHGSFKTSSEAKARACVNAPPEITAHEGVRGLSDVSARPLGELILPHPGLRERPFVLDPWMALDGERRIGAESVLQMRRGLRDACPLLMGIVNITPDSFSDGGENFSTQALEAYFKTCERTPPSILDLGGQSTRPRAEIVGIDEEWRRLQRALTQLEDLHRERVRPWISIDTYRGELARRAIEWGVEMINDVSGFDDPEMLELAKSTSAQFVFMHHLGVPVDPGVTLSAGCDPVEEVMRWARRKLDVLERAGVPLDRLIFDPGIGFGKTPSQSMELVRRARELRELPVRILFGHSRKSFQKHFQHEYDLSNQEIGQGANQESSYGLSHDRGFGRKDDAETRDSITVQQSLALADAGVEFLRVHNVPAHRRAFLNRGSEKGEGKIDEL